MTALGTTVERLSTSTAGTATRLWEAYASGAIDLVTFQTAFAAMVARANATGGALGALAFAANLTAQAGVLVAPQPVRPPDYLLAPGRVEKAVSTILGGDSDPEHRLSRLAGAEPVEAVQRTFSDSIARSKLTEGWERGLEPDACEMCHWWHRDGRVWPKDHPMPTHTGCRCMPVPTLARDIELTRALKDKERSERAIANRDRSSARVRQILEAGLL